MHDFAHILNRMNIGRPKRKSNIVNESCINACLSRFDAGAYTIVSSSCVPSNIRSVPTQQAALQSATDSDSNNDDNDDDEQSTTSTATTSTAPCPAAAAADEPADCCCKGGR